MSSLNKPISFVFLLAFLFMISCSKERPLNEAEQARKKLALAGIELNYKNYAQVVAAGDQEKIALFKTVGFNTNKFFGSNFAWACAVGDLEVVKHEIAQTENINRFLEWEPPMTPLMLACLYSHTRVAKILLDAGADPNVGRPIKTPQGKIDAIESPMFFAKRYGNNKLVNLLKEYGADDQIAKKCKKGHSPPK